MTSKTKKTVITVGIILAGIVLINRLRQDRQMVSDESSGLLGLGLFGIL
jgi:hypothetical protein